MNVQTIITIIFCSLCGVASVVMLSFGFVRWLITRHKRYKRFGYHTMTSKQSCNTLKTKVRSQVKFGYIPSVFEELYNQINIDTKVSYVKYLNKLVKRYRKKRGYYKKHVNEDANMRVLIRGLLNGRN